jgi:hypothetical protein
LVIDTPSWAFSNFRWPPKRRFRRDLARVFDLTDLESDHRLTVSSAKERTSAEPSPTSATSESRTERRRPSGCDVANLLDRDCGAENAQRLFATAHRDAATRRIETGDRQRLVTLSAVSPCAAIDRDPPRR